MFYSQFILAKKGPLGTIWIAAHLERKLRKNQVADTDIGVSVDSILSPDVPIALRLSSHLLVGVVRIYSRKVNYLFDDCSEALLKIKQAFRSTAVDLPPEESTAPYHSITLPETFDLDDFELPDNDILQGNYVDHHISSKEQITLQDTMDGVTYSTSQFGLDERFGDGDTSGLDLDEELFLSKVAAAGHDDHMFNSGTDPQSSVQPMASFSPEETNETTNSEISKQIEEIDDGTNHMEYDQAPRTPGLLEKPNLSNIQETSACDDHLEFEHQNLTESAAKENMENASSNSNLYLVNGSLCSGVGPVPVHPVSDKDNSFLANGLESSQKTPQGDLSTVESLRLAKPDSISIMFPASANEVGEISMNNDSFDKICMAPSIPNGAEDMQNGTISNNKPHISFNDKTSEDRLDIQGVGPGEINSSTCDLNNTGQPVSEAILNGASYQTEISNNVEITGDLVQSSLPGNAFKSSAKSTATSELEKSETQGRTEELNKMLELGNSVHENVACTVDKNQIEVSVSPNLLEREDDPVSAKSTVVQGEEFHDDDGSNQVVELVLCGKLDGQAENVNAVDSQLEIINSSVCSEFPAPEKLLSVPEMDTHNSLPIGATPGQLAQTEEANDTDATVTGKKRSFAESQLTMQSLNSVNSSAIVRRRTTPESVPDDDDLLSSILVGRKSLALKVKETPQQSLPFLKRHKSAPRASKRKVLMDEQMVLHGDMIRQQLTNTEDIRRLRKKAPCTRPEISMIQKQSLEDDMFGEPIFTGVSPGLTSLHNQAYDFSETRISVDDVSINNASSLQDKAGTFLEAAKDMDLYEEFDSRVAGIGGGSGILDGRVNYKAHPSEASVLVESHQHNGQSVSLDATFDVAEANNSQDLRPETIEMDVDAVNHNATGVVYSSSTVDVMRNGTGDQIASVLQLAAGVNEVDVMPQIEAPVKTTDPQPDVLSVEIDVNAADKKDHNVDIDTVHDVDAMDIVHVHATEEISSRQMEICDSLQVETEFHSEGGVAHTESVYPTTTPVDMGACGSYNLGDEHAVDEARQNEQAQLEEDMFLYAAAEYNVSNLETGGIYDVRDVTNILDPVMVDVDLRNSIHKENTEEFETDHVDYNNLDYSAAGNDTEFLNYDEDEVAEADEEDAPNAEETRFIDNSGWSSRTRAVAKYLQIMFDKEAERNQNVLPIDNLLVGKSRKEASRMFFETLVLKTKDYIHVEQATPFNNINILPRAKLTKVDF